MEKQKEQLSRLLQRLGYESSAAAEVAEDFLNPEEGAEVELPVDSILLKAQEYARPILRSTLKREFSHEFKGQYMGEAINKIVAASKGKIRRANYEDGNVERAIADLIGLMEQPTEHESVEVVNELRKQIESLAEEKEAAILQLRNEFAEKENSRLVYDSIFSRLGTMQNSGDGKVSKRLSVDQQHAAKAILRELAEEYILHYDEDARDIVIYSKTKPEERASDGSKLIGVNELIERSLQRNNWIAQSNGGSMNPRQFMNRPQHGPVKQVNEGSEFRKRLEAQVGATE